MAGIRTNAAAELLGVSANTLRSWERRLGYPRPRRTAGGHRLYELEELEALRRALAETHNISSAIEIARARGHGPSSVARLVDAFDGFDERAADRVMEESMAVRSVERTIEELLLPAVEFVHDRGGRDAEREFASRWAAGWLYSARRLASPVPGGAGVLLFEAGAGTLDVETLHAQALDVGLRRAGYRVLALSAELPPERLARAARALEPVGAYVLCGGGATQGAVARLGELAGQTVPAARVFEYRDAMPLTERNTVPSLGSRPSEAIETLRGELERGGVAGLAAG